MNYFIINRRATRGRGMGPGPPSLIKGGRVPLMKACPLEGGGKKYLTGVHIVKKS